MNRPLSECDREQRSRVKAGKAKECKKLWMQFVQEHFGVLRTSLRRQLRYDAVQKGMGQKKDILPETPRTG
jgi:hypothetical protein